MKKLIALILAMVMIMSLGATAYALEPGDYIYLRVDIEDVDSVAAQMNFGEGTDPLPLGPSTRGLYCNSIPEGYEGSFILSVSYIDANQEVITLESDPMYLADIDGMIVLDSDGFRVESATYIDSIGDSKDIPVTGIYGGGEAPADVISVAIEWGNMVFVYTPNVEWNPATHTYEAPARFTGSWELSDYGSNHVRVANHSNVDIAVELQFEGNEEYGIEGNFNTMYQGDGDIITGFNLYSADIEYAAGDYSKAPYDVGFLRIIGGEIPEEVTETVVIGEVTVLIEKTELPR